MNEDTTTTGSDSATSEDTSNTGDEAGQVSDETGGATPDEIAAALGPKYKTVAPAAEEVATDEEDTTTDTGTDEDTTTETETPAAEVKPVTPPAAEVATDGPDFSFEVEDANGVTFKIQPGDSIEDVLKDFDPKTNGQIIAVLDQLRDAKDAAKKYETDKNAELDQAAKAERLTSIQEGWDKEFKTLDITTEDRKTAIYQYMAEQNDKRSKDGRPLIASIEDAKLGLEAREAVEAKDKAAKDAKETARQNGGLVGGSSGSASSGPAPYKAGSAKNVNQALRAQNLI